MDNESTTTLLRQWREGAPGAGARLAEVLHAELQKLAHYWYSRERPGHTLQTTALVNELYVRLFSGDAPSFTDKAHLMALASRQIRHILIDHARQACAAKRGDGALRVTLAGEEPMAPAHEQELVEMDELLTRLGELDARSASVVELRFFGGLTEDEIAECLAISVPTVKRDWQFAKAWLKRYLKLSAGRKIGRA